MLVGLLVLLALRVPVAISLLVPSLVYVILDPTASLGIAVQRTVSGVNSFAILAVPLFILLGNLANISGLSDRLYTTAIAFLGHIRGSLGYVNIATSFGFSWMSGAAIADAAAMGKIQVPARISCSCVSTHSRTSVAAMAMASSSADCCSELRSSKSAVFVTMLTP